MLALDSGRVTASLGFRNPLLPKACPAKILARGVDQEHIPATAAAGLHRKAIQPPRRFRQRRQIHLIRNGDSICWGLGSISSLCIFTPGAAFGSGSVKLEAAVV